MKKRLRPRRKVVAVAGSLSSQSTTAIVAEAALQAVSSLGDTSLIRLSDISAETLFSGNRSDPVFDRSVRALGEADGVILATPIYKASMSGLMKLFLDHLPQYGLAGKTVWPIATGGSIAHALALDFGVRPILQSMGPRLIIQSCFVVPAVSGAIGPTDIEGFLNGDTRFREAALHFQAALSSDQPYDLLGHPVPDRSPGQETRRLYA